MVTTVRCAHCGLDVPRPSSPDALCPACQAPLATPPEGGYEDLDLGSDPEAPGPPPVAGTGSRQGLATAAAPPPPRPPGQSTLGAAPPVKAPAVKSTDARGGLPVIPIAVGVVLIVAIAAYALTRGRPALQAGPATAPGELKVKTIGRPPESSNPPVAEPEHAEPVVSMELAADRLPPPREPRRAAERETPARPARPAPPPREAARNEKPAAIVQPAPALAPALAPKVEPEPPLPPPPVVASPPTEPPAAPPPAAGPSSAREGYQRPRLATPGCVASALLRRRDIGDFAGQSAVVKFVVDETGKVSQFSYVSGPADPHIPAAISSSIEGCSWTPGANEQGRPVAIWVTMPISFGQ